MLNKTVFIEYVYSKNKLELFKQHNLDRFVCRFTDSKKCRYCDKEVKEEDANITISYWYPHVFYIIHNDCKNIHEEQEKYDR